MTVEPASAAGSSEYSGETYYFCSSSCKRKFDSDPKQFAGSAKRAGLSLNLGTANYTCPMHPEVVSDKPGKCPKCGMELALKVVR